MIPTLTFKFASSIPKTLAAAIHAQKRGRNHTTSAISNATTVQNKACCGYIGIIGFPCPDSWFNNPNVDEPGGWCEDGLWRPSCGSAASGIRPPAIFLALTLIFRLTGELPGAFGAVSPNILPMLVPGKAPTPSQSPLGVEVERGNQIEWCSFGYLWIYPCPWIDSSEYFSIFSFPNLLLKYVSNIPRNLIASLTSLFTTQSSSQLPASGRFESSERKAPRNKSLKGRTDHPTRCNPERHYKTIPGVFDGVSAGSSILATVPILGSNEHENEHSRVAPRGTHYPLLGEFVCYVDKASAVSVPRFFVLPTLFFKVFSAIPGAIAGAIPGAASSTRISNAFLPPTLLSDKPSSNPYTLAAVNPPSKCQGYLLCDINNKEACTFVCGTTSSSSSLSISWGFSLLSTMIIFITQARPATALALPSPQDITQSLAVPNFDLVREAVSDFLTLPNAWIGLTKEGPISLNITLKRLATRGLLIAVH